MKSSFARQTGLRTYLPRRSDSGFRVDVSYSDSSSPAAGSAFFIVAASTLTTQVINYTPWCTIRDHH
jgi:hypothetical protein